MFPTFAAGARCAGMKTTIALAALVAVALVPATAEAKRGKVLRGDFTLVGSDGDYVTGKFGKAHLVDGKRNDKLSVHVRRLAKRTTYTFKLQTGSCGGAEVTGWRYRALKTSRKGVGNSWARSRTFKAAKGTKYFVAVYGPDGQMVVCARLSSKGHSHPHKGHGKRDHAPGTHDKPHGKRDDAPGQRGGQAPRPQRRCPRPRRGQGARQERRGPGPREGQGPRQERRRAGPQEAAALGRAYGPGRDRRPGSQDSVARVQPALQRGVPDERDLAVGVDPVADAQLAHEPERVARAGAVTVGGERAGAGLDGPATGVQRGQRPALFLGRGVERVRARVGQRVVP